MLKRNISDPPPPPPRDNANHYIDDLHYNDVIMGTIASQITSLAIVYSTVYSDSDQRKKFPAQMASNAENGSIWWRHHECKTAVTPVWAMELLQSYTKPTIQNGLVHVFHEKGFQLLMLSQWLEMRNENANVCICFLSKSSIFPSLVWGFFQYSVTFLMGISIFGKMAFILKRIPATHFTNMD